MSLTSQKSLKMSSFLFIVFSITDFHYSVFQLQIHSSVLFSLLLTDFSVFFISVIIFFIYAWLFFFSLLKTSNLSVCAAILFLSSLAIFMRTSLNSFLVRFHISYFTQFFFWGFYLNPLFGTWSSVASFCLTSCFCFLCI